MSHGFSATFIASLWPEVYCVRDLGFVRALAVSASVAATAIGPGLTGYLIDQHIALPTQMIFLEGWCVAACVILAFIIAPYILKEMRQSEIC